MGDAVGWFETVGGDGAGPCEFYADLFGWRIAGNDADMDDGLVAAGVPNIAGGSGHVAVCVEVDDPAACLARAEELGGRGVVPPTEVPGWDLTFALIADPDGHMIGLASGAAAAAQLPSPIPSRHRFAPGL